MLDMPLLLGDWVYHNSLLSILFNIATLHDLFTDVFRIGHILGFVDMPLLLGVDHNSLLSMLLIIATLHDLFIDVSELATF